MQTALMEMRAVHSEIEDLKELKLILDTKAISAYLDRSPEAVEIVSEAREIAIPVILAGGSFSVSPGRATRRRTNRSLQRMLDRCTVLGIEIETTRRHAAIRPELKAAGKPIPANDEWIAALSRRHSMTVMSRNSHFDFVGGLRRRTW
jgi:tRNA(fMet)-specific endonuclease VapC